MDMNTRSMGPAIIVGSIVTAGCMLIGAELFQNLFALFLLGPLIGGAVAGNLITYAWARTKEIHLDKSVIAGLLSGIFGALIFVVIINLITPSPIEMISGDEYFRTSGSLHAILLGFAEGAIGGLMGGAIGKMVVKRKYNMFLISGASGILLGLFTLGILITMGRGLMYSAPFQPGPAPIFLSLYVPSIFLAVFAVVLMIHYPETWKNSGARLRCLYIFVICYVLGYGCYGVLFFPLMFVYGLLAALLSSSLSCTSLLVMAVVAYLVIPEKTRMRGLAVLGLVLLLICCGWWVTLAGIMFT
jgi:hypothetical protein